MAEIRFKATRRHHSSGYREITKSGDLDYDQDSNSHDGIWLQPDTGDRIFIDCDAKTGEFRIVFVESNFDKNYQSSKEVTDV